MKLLFIRKWKARRIEQKLDTILEKLETMMPSLDETLTQVRGNTDRINSLQALMDGIQAQLADVLSGTVIPPAVQTKIDAIFDEVKAQGEDIDSSLNANVPPPEPSA